MRRATEPPASGTPRRRRAWSRRPPRRWTPSLDRLLVDPAQADRGVGVADRELDHEERHPVAHHRAVLVTPAPGHGHHRLEGVAHDRFPVTGEVGAERSGAQREDDVVHRHVRPSRITRTSSRSTSALTQRRCLPTGVFQGAGGVDTSRSPTAVTTSPTARRTRCGSRSAVHRRLHDLHRARRSLHEAVHEQAARGGRRPWVVDGAGWDLGRSGHEIADREEEVDVGDAVTHRVGGT